MIAEQNLKSDNWIKTNRQRAIISYLSRLTALVKQSSALKHNSFCRRIVNVLQNLLKQIEIVQLPAMVSFGVMSNCLWSMPGLSISKLLSLSRF